MLDFSTWLAGQAAEHDYVVLSLALGEGRDFKVLDIASSLLECVKVLTEIICNRSQLQIMVATIHDGSNHVLCTVTKRGAV